jgi:hypothetical protein
MLIGKDHLPLLTKISKIKMRHLICGSVLFSFLINIGHFFQYRINYGWGRLMAELFSEYYFTYDIYPSIVVNNLAFRVYSIVYFFVNFVVFFLINTCIEVSIVRKLRHEIAEKRIKAEEDISHMTRNNPSGSAVVNKVIKSKRKRIEQDAKKETRAIVMVIVNSGLNFALRLPEILVFLSSSVSVTTALMGTFVGEGMLNFFSYFLNDVETMLVSLSYFMYILTFTTNVVIFYLFNTKFKHLFMFWTSYVKHK